MAAKPLLLVEALATRNDSGLGNMARLFAESLIGLADSADILMILPRGSAWRPGPFCRILEADARPWRAWINLAFPLIIRRHRPAAVLCLGQTLPRWRPKSRYIQAIPDAGPLEDLGWATSSHDPYNRGWLADRAPRADAILTISAFTKERLQHLLGIPPDRISVVLPIRYPPLPAPTGGRHPDGEYFLSLGNVEPRKNFPGLISAYAALRARRPDAPPLYIVGHKAWGIAEAETAVAVHGLGSYVHFTGYLSAADARAYLEHCTAYVSSSLYEGWGLPLFEALALGRPSAYHAGSSQEEFASGIALAVDCGDPEALSRAMERLWCDTGERARLGAAMTAGSRRVQAYDVGAALRGAILPVLKD
jgi:glycosyltransferase involved in cell wall biosynthesis